MCTISDKITFQFFKIIENYKKNTWFLLSKQVDFLIIFPYFHRVLIIKNYKTWHNFSLKTYTANNLRN